MSWLTQGYNAVVGAAKKAEKNAQRGFSNLIHPIIGDIGVANILGGRSIGGHKRGPKRPRDVGGCTIDPRTGREMGQREPMQLTSRIVVAAGVLSQTVALDDFFKKANAGNGANNNPVTADFTIAGDFVAEEASLFIGIRANAVAPVENPATLMSFYIVEKKNGREVSRYSPKDLGCTVGATGAIGASTGTTGYTYKIDSEAVEFYEEYDPTLPYNLELWLGGAALTTVNVLDFTLVLTGHRA